MLLMFLAKYFCGKKNVYGKFHALKPELSRMVLK